MTSRTGDGKMNVSGLWPIRGRGGAANFTIIGPAPMKEDARGLGKEEILWVFLGCSGRGSMPLS